MRVNIKAYDETFDHFFASGEVDRFLNSDVVKHFIYTSSLEITPTYIPM